MTQILDQYGKPFKKSQLKTQQTAEISALARTWPEHPSLGLTIQKLPRILQAAEQGDLSAQAHLFNDMQEKDGHIFAEMAKRKNALLTLDWSIQPPKNATPQEKKLAEQVGEWFEDLSQFEDVILNALEAIGHGFSCQEIEWELTEKLWLPKKFNLQPHYWFSTRPEQPNQLRLNDGTMYGQELIPFGWLVHTHNAKSGFITQAGLFRVLVWPYLFKNYALRDLAEFLEIYGLPARIGKFMPGATDEERDSLLKAVVMIGHHAAGIIPDNTSISFESAASGQSEPFEAMIAWAERTQSKVITGGTLTSQADGKSSTNALGNVHNEVRHDLKVSDAKQLNGLFSDLIVMLCQLNGYSEINRRRLPKFVFDTRDIEDLGTFADGVSKLVSAGLETIPVSWVHTKLAIPVPNNDEPVLKRQVYSPMALSQIHTPHIAALNRQIPTDPAQYAIDNVTLPETVSMAMAQLVAPMVEYIKQGTTPDEVVNLIAASYPQLNDVELRQLLAQAIFVADILGRVNA